MKLCYQVATPDVTITENVTAYQGPLESSFADLAQMGYDGVELMTMDPGKLDWDSVHKLAEKNGLAIVLVCTGEILGQMNLSFADPRKDVRQKAVEQVNGIIDFASALGANINIGRVRGQYYKDVPVAQTETWAVDAFKYISDHAGKKNVWIALETITIMQTNFINTLMQAREMIKRVERPNFGLMMDVFHLNLEERDILQAIHEYSAYNLHVHLADNNRRYPGQCGLDFEKILRAFRDEGYDGAFSTEIYQIPDQRSAAEGAIAHLAPILQKVYKRPIR
ncbi:MAG: sugar phosphate isomerase/epimerase family protein [Christensenellales bacterium]|jgi:sugar phosphate isomerase/epimerase